MDIILMGLPKSGKTSIQRVVFQKMSPHETFFLTPTPQIEVTSKILF
jgi:Ras-related GTP-binding protein C/D